MSLGVSFRRPRAALLLRAAAAPPPSLVARPPPATPSVTKTSRCLHASFLGRSGCSVTLHAGQSPRSIPSTPRRPGRFAPPPHPTHLSSDITITKALKLLLTTCPTASSAEHPPGRGMLVTLRFYALTLISMRELSVPVPSVILSVSLLLVHHRPPASSLDPVPFPSSFLSQRSCFLPVSFVNAHPRLRPSLSFFRALPLRQYQPRHRPARTPREAYPCLDTRVLPLRGIAVSIFLD
jgi:hypothetical protein